MHKPKKTKLNVFNAKNVHENRSYTKASLVKKKKKKKKKLKKKKKKN